MNLRFPLYAKILLWFFLNLLLLGVVFYGFLRVQFHLGLDSLIAGEAGQRIQSVTTLITEDLNSHPKSEWNGIMKRYTDAYKMQFLLVRNNDATQIAGETVELPEELKARALERRIIPPGQFNRPPGEDPRENFRKDGGPGGPQSRVESFREQPPPQPRDNQPPHENQPGRENQPPREGGDFDGPRRGKTQSRFESFSQGGQPFRGDGSGGPEFRPGRGIGGPPPGQNAKYMLHTSEPSRYWVLVRIPVFDRERPRPSPVSLVMMSASLSGGGLFFDAGPWLTLGVGALCFSVLFWLPLVRSITRSISQMTSATEQVAEGQFDIRVDDTRKDELGRLGLAVNRMGTRLSGFVMGQKRFLGDIAHELCSPIARVQAALGILEQRANENQKPYVEDVREEVQHMSSLVNELLSFSKAGLKAKEIQTQPVNVADVARRAVDREAADSGKVQLQVPNELQAMAEPELLLRALANLVRNAIRYAGDAGPITVSACPREGQVVITVADSGPGVPDAMLQQIFDPFFRLESSRSRDTGGIGLGLAIVKTCVESCQGTIVVRNRTPSGLEVDIRLQTVPEPKPATS